MPHTSVANRRKRRTKTVPVLGAAGLSFSLVAGTPAAVGSITPSPITSALVGQPRMEEEQIPEVSLATFHVPDEDSVGPQLPTTRPITVTKAPVGQTSIFLGTRQRSVGQVIRHHRSDLGQYVPCTNTSDRETLELVPCGCRLVG